MEPNVTPRHYSCPETVPTPPLGERGGPASLPRTPKLCPQPQGVKAQHEGALPPPCGVRNGEEA